MKLRQTSLLPPPCSVCKNSITGDAAKTLADVVLGHAILTIFCDIPLTSLRENSIEELDLSGKGFGVPGFIVLSKLLLSNTSLKSAKCVVLSCAPASKPAPFHPWDMSCEKFVHTVKAP
jgi:hypothetical protein